MIPDTPSHVLLAIRKENYEVQKRLEEAAKKGDKLKSTIKYKSVRENLEGTPYKKLTRNLKRRDNKRQQESYRQGSTGKSSPNYER